MQVVHREIHLGVTIGEDNLIHDKSVECLLRRSLEAGDGESAEDLCVKSERKSSQRQ